MSSLILTVPSVDLRDKLIADSSYDRADNPTDNLCEQPDHSIRVFVTGFFNLVRAGRNLEKYQQHPRDKRKDYRAHNKHILKSSAHFNPPIVLVKYIIACGEGVVKWFVKFFNLRIMWFGAGCKPAHCAEGE